MDNNKKLELTLFGMLPYGLKCSFSTDEIYTLNGIVNKDLWLKELTYPADYFSCKPYLHSLNKLTEPILEGGLIPIVELLKIIHPKEDYTSKYGLISVSEVGHPCAWYTYSANFSLTIWLNDLEKTPFWIIEKLKEWHFNIYDLPKEMYIEKSIL